MVIDRVATASDKASDAVDKAAEIGESAMEKGFESAREFADTGLDYMGDLTERVSGFVKREPWIAVAGAFVIGYVAAHLFRRTK
jgi:ElaB/YqjD/DUF883 family membrane-anchored ribosome-binding protein